MSADESHDAPSYLTVALSEGTMVSHYRIIEKIGSGGMGEVYLAEDSKLKRRVALKFLAAGEVGGESLTQQFTQEAQAAAGLQHPNIITIHEVNNYKGVPFVAMDYIDGASLKDYSSSKSLLIADIIDIGIQIASGLTAAHESGITHRDLKPANLMVNSAGSIKILDFGLALISDRESNTASDDTRTSDPNRRKLAGTVAYMAPEQLLGEAITPRVDIFALGVILYELIAGKHPFKASSISETSASILRDTPSDLNNTRSNVPYDLNRIVQRCMAKKPDRRFQTVRDVCNELEELSAELKENVASAGAQKKESPRRRSITEESFVLSTDVVRKLSRKNPEMVGGSLTYIDNRVSSDLLVIFLHAFARDHGQYSDAIQELPYRAIALSLFGFEEDAQLRLPLTLHDHSILMHALIKDVCGRLRPNRVVLVGHSSGADHVLHYLSSEEFTGIEVTGVLSLGCNIHFDDCFATAKFANIASGDEDQILSTIREFGGRSSTLDEWLLNHSYLLTAFSKFGNATDPLRQYANDIIEPFKAGRLEQFPIWYKTCAEKCRFVRFIVDTDGHSSLDKLMRKHIENNVLGIGFQEDSIVRAPCSHMELGETDMILKYTLDFLKLMEPQ